jgi:hypothetical protein
LRWAWGWSLAFAALFSLWVGLLALLSGSARFDKYEMSAAAIIRTYFAVALVAGIVLGVLRPITETALGRVFVGSIVGTAVYTGIGLSMYGPDKFTFVGGAILGIPMGGFLGYKWSK